jgi:hypothetical protein
MAKFGHKSVAASPTTDVDQALADSLGVSLDHLQKNIYSALPLSEEDAADIDDTSFFAENADAGAVVEPAQADEPVCTPGAPPKATGKRTRPTDDDAQRTPRASKPPGDVDGDDGSPEFQKRPPPSPVFHRGIRPHDRQMSAAIHKNTSRLFEYYEERGATAIKGLMDIIEARFTAVLAKQDDTIRVLKEGHAAEIRTLNGKIQTLTDELSEVKIMQTRMAASVAHQQQQPQQRQQPQQQQQPQQHQQPQQQQQQRQPQQQQRQQPQQQQRQQQGSRNPNPPFQPTRSAPELNEEEFPSLPTSEWKVREDRYTQRARRNSQASRRLNGKFEKIGIPRGRGSAGSVKRR